MTILGRAKKKQILKENKEILTTLKQEQENARIREATASYRRAETILASADLDNLDPPLFEKMMVILGDARHALRRAASCGVALEEDFDLDGFESRLKNAAREPDFRRETTLWVLRQKLNLKALAPLRLDHVLEDALDEAIAPEVVVALTKPVDDALKAFEVGRNPLVYRVPVILLGQEPWSNFREVVSVTGMEDTDIEAIGVLYQGDAYPTLASAKEAASALK